jgi:hypothetical protein
MGFIEVILTLKPFSWISKSVKDIVTFQPDVIILLIIRLICTQNGLRKLVLKNTLYLTTNLGWKEN